jgi:HTH-type transcriptional repressor of NAD biosynthesis genes
MEESIQQQDSDCLRIVIFGPESTGKTTLAKALAEAYQTNWVPEYAREYLQKKWDDSQQVCDQEDLIQIVKGQMLEENRQLLGAKQFLFCDTNVLVTQVWSETHFNGNCDSRIKNWADTFRYDYYFLTHIDVPWQADDLRDRPNDRKLMFDAFKASLVTKKLPFTILEGNHSQRMKQVNKVLKKLLKK